MKRYSLLTAASITAAMLVPATQAAATGPSCTGGTAKPFLNRDQEGAYVNYAAQFHCIRPQSFSLQASLFQKFPDGSLVPITSSGKSGTAKDPSLVGNSRVCVNSQLSTYVVTVKGAVAGQSVDQRGERSLVCGL